MASRARSRETQGGRQDHGVASTDPEIAEVRHGDPRVRPAMGRDPIGGEHGEGEDMLLKTTDTAAVMPPHSRATPARSGIRPLRGLGAIATSPGASREDLGPPTNGDSEGSLGLGVTSKGGRTRPSSRSAPAGFASYHMPPVSPGNAGFQERRAGLSITHTARRIVGSGLRYRRRRSAG
jgi:hypothetical protein